jgi:C1A family cysteine protease
MKTSNVYRITLVIICIVFFYSNVSFVSLKGLKVSNNSFDSNITDSPPDATINGNKYSFGYISEENIEEVKSQIKLREDDKNYNIQFDGHGTGLAPPSEEDLNNLIGKKLIKNVFFKPQENKLGVSYDLSSQIYFPTVGNQQSQGSCAAWAVTYYVYGYLEAKDCGWNASSGDAKYLMSPAWTFNKVATSPDDGSWMTTNAQILIDWGCATLDVMPYDSSDYFSWGNEPAWREAPLHRAFDYYLLDFDEVNPDSTIDTIKNFINSGTPVTFAFDASQYTGFNDGNYILSSVEYNSLSYNHAQCIVGFNDSKSDDGDIGAFKVVNSWGKNFADDGYYWLTYECLKEIGYAIGDFCLQLCILMDRIDYNPDLIATWEFQTAPTRMQDIITLRVGPYDTPLANKNPWYEYDDNYMFPNFMSFDISDFLPYYKTNPEVSFFLDVGSSINGGTISSFILERYIDGALVEITSESTDVPKSTPGYVRNNFITPSLTISNPNNKSSWKIGTSQDIIWNSTGIIPDVKIELYNDNLFSIEIVSSTSNDGSYNWTIPSDLNTSTQYQFKISDASNPFIYNYSEYFKIFTPIIVIINPSSLTKWETRASEKINWTSIGTILHIKIELYKNDLFIMEIVKAIPNNGSYFWTIPSDLEEGGDYQIKITDASESSIFNFSECFKIVSPSKVIKGIPSYTLFFPIIIISIITVVLFKNRKKVIT